MGMNRNRRIVQRNPFVVPAMFRKAGKHSKTTKALRRAERVMIIKRIEEVDNR